MLNTHNITRDRRSRAAITVAIALFVAAAVAVPVWGRSVDGVFPWQGNGPHSVTLDQAHASRLFSIPSRGKNTLSFWSIPSSSGQACIATRVVDAAGNAPVGAPPAFANAGLNCSIGGSAQPAGQIQTFLSWTAADGSFTRPADGNWAVTLLGHLPSGGSITSVQLQTSSGTVPLAVHNGFFAATLPGTTSSLSALPGTGNAVVGLDSAGNVVQTVNLDAQVGATTP